MTTYTYNINQTINNKVNISKLVDEVNESTIHVALDNITQAGNFVKCAFKDQLYYSEEQLLDGIIYNHDGALLPDQVPKMADGRPIVRADSRPLNTETYFSCAGDAPGKIGEGTKFFWDFSNDDDILAIADPYTTMKRKRVILTFNDLLWIKEGTIYVFNALKGSYCNFMIMAPPYYPYYNRDHELQYAGAEPVILYRYVHHHFFAGSIPMGDELNTEGCQQDGVPAGYWVVGDIYVPLEDDASYGWCSLESYRTRSCLFPGESI
jgi:hypothetical protein